MEKTKLVIDSSTFIGLAKVDIFELFFNTLHNEFQFIFAEPVYTEIISKETPVSERLEKVINKGLGEIKKLDRSTKEEIKNLSQKV
jgi:hypothetical protein